MANRAAQSSLLKSASLQVIPNPIDPVYLEPAARLSARSKMGIEGSTKVVTVVAKNLTDPNKQVQKIVHEFERFTNTSQKQALLLLVGDGGERILSGPLVRRLGNLAPQDLKHVYSATDVIVSGSEVESFGLTLSEGAALGVPSIATSGHAASEGIVDGDNGFIISNCSELAKKLSIVFSLTSGELESIGAKGKAKVHKESHPTVVANSYSRIYEELLRK
jgi:glycosyltransferase involved in cell wall biosynthesis